MFASLKRVLTRKIVQQTVYRPSSEMSVDAWRRIPDMVKIARNILDNADTRLMLDACRNSHMIRSTLDGMPDLAIRAIIQAQCEGYTMALNDFELLGRFKKPEEPLKETFEPDDQKE